MNTLIKRGLLNALGTTAYVVLIVIFISNVSKMFGGKDSVFAPMAALMLFVLSATITGGLVVGKPLLMYFNGEKSAAVKLFIFTVCWLAVFTFLLFVANLTKN